VACTGPSVESSHFLWLQQQNVSIVVYKPIGIIVTVTVASSGGNTLAAKSLAYCALACLSLSAWAEGPADRKVSDPLTVTSMKVP
jgi:hypothetical protein